MMQSDCIEMTTMYLGTRICTKFRNTRK